MTDFNAQLDTILEQHGVDPRTAFADTDARLAVTAFQGADGFAAVVLPAELCLIHSQADVEGAVQRIATDDAFFVSNLRAIALYVRAKFDGTEYSKEAITQFYDLYGKSSDEDKESAQVGTLRIIQDLVAEEAERCVALDGKQGIGDIKAMMTEQFEEIYAQEGVKVLYAALEQPIATVLNLAQVLDKAEQKGKTVLEGRDINRSVGAHNMMLLNMTKMAVAGQMTKALFGVWLPADVVDTIDAMATKEAALQNGEETVVH